MLPSIHLSSLSSPLLTIVSALAQYVPTVLPNVDADNPHMHTYAKRELGQGEKIAFGILIPVLVLLSGLFAGLTLGYMSLDETQLNVLSISGTPKQKEYANKIKPIRKNGHLLLVTLLLSNMITNETLPVIADPVLGGGVQSVVVSTVLIVIFSEIIPQSLCTRYGLYFGAKMAGMVRVLIWTVGIVAWPVAKLLEIVLGSHHGIIYRRAELKELIAMHSNAGELGGDLKTDTVTIIGGALDLQEKVVKQAMTPIEQVFMLSIDAQLDYDTLRKICLTGHSRIPVYEEVEIPAPAFVTGSAVSMPAVMESEGTSNGGKIVKVKKIVGILLVKQCVLLDPKDATPLRKIPLNKVPLVPHNEPLLGILDKFQEGRSHMAIVSRFSVARAASVKQAVKRGLTQRFRDAIGDSDTSSSDSDSESESGSTSHKKWTSHLRRKRSDHGEESSENEQTLRESSHGEASDAASRSSGNGGSRPKKGRGFSGRGRRKQKGRRSEDADLEMGVVKNEEQRQSGSKSMRPSLAMPKAGFWGREQDVPADAVLSTKGAEEFLQAMDPAIMPLGIITLEDVLEELIGEEIYDEFDPQGHPDMKSYAGPEVKSKPKLTAKPLRHRRSAPQLVEKAEHTATAAATSEPEPESKAESELAPADVTASPNAGGQKAVNAFLAPINTLASKISRSRSAPPTPREERGRAKVKDSEGVVEPVLEGVIVVAPPQSETAQTIVAPEDEEQDVKSPALAHSASVAFQDTVESPVLPLSVISQAVRAEPIPRARFSPLVSMSPLASPVPAVAVSPTVGATLAAASKPASRSSSPSPSLEHAIMIERKRRAASAGAGTMPAPKGARFKSSPLGGERGGVVVAERVKREMSVGEETDVDASKEKDGADGEKE